jgi:hypothetical protein
VEKQPTAAELEEARGRARADAEATFAAGEIASEPGEQPYAYAAEAVQAAYAEAYEARLEELREDL